MHTSVRLYRTAAGKLVEHGHLDAVVLAYGENDEVDADDRAAAEKLQPKGKAEPKVDAEHTAKVEAKPAPKRRAPRKRAAAKPAPAES